MYRLATMHRHKQTDGQTDAHSIMPTAVHTACSIRSAKNQRHHFRLEKVKSSARAMYYTTSQQSYSIQKLYAKEIVHAQ